MARPAHQSRSERGERAPQRPGFAFTDSGRILLSFTSHEGGGSDGSPAPGCLGDRPHRNLLADQLWDRLGHPADPDTRFVDVNQQELTGELGVSHRLIGLACARLRNGQQVYRMLSPVDV